MSGYLIIQWPHGDRKILDCVTDEQVISYDILQKYSRFFSVAIDWVQADQKDWLREHGFIT